MAIRKSDLGRELAKSGLTVICVILLAACQNMPKTLWMQETQDSAPSAPTEAHVVTISELYSNPSFDAQVAIAVNDLRLLTFSEQTQESSLPPGVPTRIKLANLSKHCGLRALPSSSVVLDASFDARQRQTIFDYATTYNQKVLAACEKVFGRALR